MSWINKLKDKAMYLSVLLFSQLFMMSKSFAVFNEPGANDISRSFLNEIFGSLLDGGSDAFGASVGTFNGAILTVGGILAAYTILAGTLGTAHDGEMLGKKFSSVYIPIRYALGTALVLPVLSGGYCVMQALVMWIIMQGVSLGNTVWTAYAKNPPALKAPVSAATKLSIKQFVEDVYLAQVCVAANKRAHSEKPGLLSGFMTYDYKAKRIDGIIGTTGGNGAGGAVVGKGARWEFGDQGGIVGNTSLCGWVDEPKAPQTRINQFGISNAIGSLRGIEQAFTVVDLTPIYQAHVAAIEEVVSKTGQIAEKAIDKPESANYSEISSIIDSYVSKLNSAVTGVASSQQNMQNSAGEQGWFLAGTWVTKVIFAQNKINAQVNQTGKANIITYKNTDSNSDEVARYSSNGYMFLVSQRPELAGIAKNVGDKKDKDAQGSSTGLGGMAANIINNFIVGIDLEDLKNDDRHPLIVMIRVGDGILGAILTGITLSAGIAMVAGASVLGSSAGVTPATIVIFSTLAGPLLAFIGTGAMLTYILPNLPFMIWMGIIIGWTIMVIEAIIAAPLWAVMHLHPNGDDLTGRGGNGYMLVLGLLLRPTLVIFGLIASIVLSGLFGQFVNRVFFDVFSSNMGDSGVGFFGMIFGCGIYAAIMMTVIKQTFNLMHVVPDQLMRWIGGGGEQLGQYAGGFSGEGMAKASAAAGAAVGYMANTSASSVGKFGEIKAQNSNKLATDNQTKLDQIARAESKQLGIDKDESEFDAKLGVEGLGSQINSKYNELNTDGSIKKHGANTVEGIQDRLQASNTNSTLGGNGSVGAETYKATLSEGLAGGQDFSSAHAAAFSAGADAKWGAGASKSIEALKDSGMPMNTIMAQLDNKQSKIMSKTRDPEKTHEIMSGMFKEANSSKGGNFKEAFVNASQNVNKALDLQPGGRKVETATAPIPEPGDNKGGDTNEDITNNNNGDFKS